MKISNKHILTSFARKHTDATHPINKWVQVVENYNFRNHNELKSAFPSADFVGNKRYVFNIKGNHYRLVVLVVFTISRMQVRFCGAHAEYDKLKDIGNI